MRRLGSAVTVSLGAALAGMFVVSVDRVAAAADGMVIVQITGQPTVLAVAQITLVDAEGIDVGPTNCALEVGPGVDRLRCTGLADGSDQARLIGPATGVGFQSSCAPTDPGQPAAADLRAVISPSVRNNLCLASVWATDGSGVITASVSAQMFVPASLVAQLHYQFVDQEGVDRFAELCGWSDANINCITPPAGNYHFALLQPPGGVGSEYRCHALFGGPALASPTDIEISTATVGVECVWAIGARTVQLRVVDADVGGVLPGVAAALHPAGQPTIDVPCIVIGAGQFQCEGLVAGAYEFSSNLSSLGMRVDALQCVRLPTWTPIAGAPLAFTDAAEVQFVSCTLGYHFPTTTVTTMPHTSTSDAQSSPGAATTVAARSGGVLPVTGGGPTVPIAVGVLALGLAASLVARRTVR